MSLVVGLMVFSEQGDFFTQVPSNGKRGEREVLMSKLENEGRERRNSRTLQ